MPKKKPEREPGSLYKATFELFNNRKASQKITIIAEATGLNKQWLSAFGLGNMQDPSVNFVQTLYEYLTGTQLKV